MVRLDIRNFHHRNWSLLVFVVNIYIIFCSSNSSRIHHRTICDITTEYNMKYIHIHRDLENYYWILICTIKDSTIYNCADMWYCDNCYLSFFLFFVYVYYYLLLFRELSDDYQSALQTSIIISLFGIRYYAIAVVQ